MFVLFNDRYINGDKIISIRRENLSVYVETEAHVYIVTYEALVEAKESLDILLRDLDP